MISFKPRIHNYTPDAGSAGSNRKTFSLPPNVKLVDPNNRIRAPQSASYDKAQDLFAQATAHGKKIEQIDVPLLNQAIEMYKRTLEAYPDNFFVMGNLGFSYFLLKEYNASLHYYKNATEIAPKHPLCQVFYNDMGTACLEMRNRDDALLYYTNAIKLLERSNDNSSRSTFPYKNRALLYKKAGEYKKALADIMRAIQLEGTKGRLYNFYTKLKEEILQESGGTPLY